MDPETFESLWEYCITNYRAIPKDWNKLYSMLINKRQKPSGGWEPSLPLILAAWDITMPIEKQLRFKEHVLWAEKNGQLAQIASYLKGLKESDWYHFGEL